MSCLARETSPPASKQRIKGAGGVTRSCVAAAGREEGLGLRAQSNLCVEACRAQRLLSRRGRLESSNLDSEARGDVTRAAVAGPLERTRLPARCARTGGAPIPATSKLEHPLETINFASRPAGAAARRGFNPKPQIHAFPARTIPSFACEKSIRAQRHPEGQIIYTWASSLWVAWIWRRGPLCARPPTEVYDRAGGTPLEPSSP